jgi:2-hydroxycyclohexanecarboxyl-CoA dehydrogenase
MGGLNDKIAIVTGGGQGIGRAISEKLAAERATVVGTDLVGQNASQTADGLPGAIPGSATRVSLAATRLRH